MKVAVVGTTPSSKMLAPYRDESWEIWACSPDNAMQLPRVDRWFEIHSDIGYPGGEGWEKPYVDWLNEQTFDHLYVHKDRLEMFGLGEAFDFDTLIREFTAYFFTSTPAWMVGLAIHEGATEIGLYGMDMASNHEYRLQRPGMHHMLLEAEKRGIGLTVPMESDLLMPPPLYGVSLGTPIGRKVHIRRRELMGRLAELDRVIEQAKRDRHYIEGAVDDLDYFETIWTGHKEVHRAQEVQRPKVVNLKGEDHG